jgi:hypothetical protein
MLLSLPIETHSLALRLITLLNATFTLSNVKRKKTGGYAESRLLAFLIIACKLGYDLENTKEWKEWAKATQGETEGEERVKWDDVTEETILGMEDTEVDKYLDWVQRTYIEDDDGFYASTLTRYPFPSLLPFRQHGILIYR